MNNEWQEYFLDKICTRITVGFVGKCNPFYTNETGVPLIRTGNLQKGELNLSTLKYVTPEFHKKNKKSQLHTGDILIARHGSSGQAVLFSGELPNANSLNIVIVRPDTKFVEPRFLKEMFNSSTIQQSISRRVAGSTQGVINTKEIQKTKFIIPPLLEQRKIAEILSTWDEAIAKTEQLILALQLRKKGLMQRLLTGKVRFEGFDGEWNEVVLGDLGERYSGLSGKTKEDFGDGAPYIPYKNIFNNSSVTLSELDYVSVQEGERQNAVKCGDIFFTVSSETADEVAMSSVLLDDIDKCYLNSFCFGFRLHDFSKLIPEFAQYLFRSTDFRRKTFQLAQGFTRYNISKLQLLKLPITLPPIIEQEKISVVLQASDAEIELQSKKLAALQKQKKGLMQRLLTGQVRV